MSAGKTKRLPGEEQAARCAIVPQIFKDKQPFDPRQLIRFKEVVKKQFRLSVGSRTLLPTIDDVHGYGCRTAATSNAHKAEKLGHPPSIDEGSSHYLGFYNFVVADAEQSSNEVYDVYVELVPENGEDAHSEVVMAEKTDIDKNAAKSMARAFVADSLWLKFAGPESHRCDVDKLHKEYLEDLVLPLGGTVAA